MAELQYNLNRLAGTSNLDSQLAANIWAGTAQRYSTTGNMLTTNQATLETDSTGWGSAVLNCTVARTTLASLSGAGSLLMTVTTAGNIQAFSDPVSNIIPGTTYTVSWAVKADAANVSASQPTVIGIRWLTAASAYISDSQVGTSNTTKTAWNRPTYSAVAPATAAKAMVIVYFQSTSVGDKFYADEIGLWEGTGGDWQLPGTALWVNGRGPSKDLVGALNAKAGLPTATYSSSGNLLTATQASFESGTTGWEPDGTTAVTSDPAFAKDGTRSMRVDIGVTNAWGATTATSKSPVSASTAYTAVASFHNGVGARTTYIASIDWYNGATYLSSSAGSAATPGLGWAESVVNGTSPATATHACVRVNPTSVGSTSDTFYVDRVGLWQGTGGIWAPGGYPITLSATGTKDLDGALNAVAGTTNLDANAASDACLTSKVNLIPANGASFETDASYWDINASLTKQVTTATCAAGNQSLQVTMNVAGGDLGIKGFTPASNIACTAGNTYTFVASFLKGVGSRQNYYIYGEWRNAGNTTISTFQSTKITANTWSEARVTATAPALTTSVQLWFVVFDTGVSTDTFYVDKIGMWQDNPTAQWSL